MPINICQLYNDTKGVNNTWQKGHLRNKTFVAITHLSQLEIFNDFRQQWQKTNIISDALAPFFKTVQLDLKQFNLGGKVIKPKGYCGFSSLRYFTKGPNGQGVYCDTVPVLDACSKKSRKLREEEKVAAMTMDMLVEHPINKIPNNQWGSYSVHELVGPSLDNPAVTECDGGFKVLPLELNIVLLDYLALPERPVFKAVTDAKHNTVCVEKDCKDLLWGEEILPDLMSRIKTKYASFIQNQVKYAEGVKETELAGLA